MGMFESFNCLNYLGFAVDFPGLKLKLARKESWLKSDGREIKYCIDGKFIIHHMNLANLFRGASCCQNMGTKPPSYVLTGMLRLQSKLELTSVADDKLQSWPKEMVLTNRSPKNASNRLKNCLIFLNVKP